MKQFIKSFLILTVCLSLVSCDMIIAVFTAEESVEVFLPEIPQAAKLCPAEVPGTWTLRWINSTGSKEIVPGVRRKCIIYLKKGHFTPVIAELDTRNPKTGPFPLAGGLYPAQSKGSLASISLSLEYTGGIAALSASKAMECATGGIETAKTILSTFNWERLGNEIEKLDTPEYFDFDRLVSAMLSGQVRVYDVRTRKKRAVRLHLSENIVPAGTKFISAWPGDSGFSWPENNTISLNLPVGLCRFYSTRGVITVQSGGNTPGSIFFSSYSLQE